jgi:DNA-binding transcriptional regulator YiaG
MIDETLTLGQFITKKREEHGYKKIEFAKLIQVGDDSLRSWEKDRFVPAGKNMVSLIKILKFSPEEMKHYFRTSIYG